MADIIGFGTTLGYSVAGTTYTTIAKVTELDRPKQTVSDAKNSHLTSTGATHTYLPGMIEPGEVACKIIYDKTLENTLLGFFQARTTLFWKITMPDGTTTGSTYVFNGFIKEFGGSVPMEETVQTEIKIKVTGVTTFTAGT
jgi:hypothetical protein